MVPGTSLPDLEDSSYSVTVQVESWLGLTDSATFTFNKVTAGAAPVVSLVGGLSQTFLVSSGLRLTSQLDASSVCAGKEVRCSGQQQDNDAWRACTNRQGCILRPHLGRGH